MSVKDKGEDRCALTWDKGSLQRLGPGESEEGDDDEGRDTGPRDPHGVHCPCITRHRSRVSSVWMDRQRDREVRRELSLDIKIERAAPSPATTTVFSDCHRLHRLESQALLTRGEATYLRVPANAIMQFKSARIIVFERTRAWAWGERIAEAAIDTGALFGCLSRDNAGRKRHAGMRLPFSFTQSLLSQTPSPTPHRHRRPHNLSLFSPSRVSGGVEWVFGALITAGASALLRHSNGSDGTAPPGCRLAQIAFPLQSYRRALR
ncbi:hypothetical protein SKAU_G00084750 [Synaphobranchus kaupii]|uniref:Uncharacterized protein n=1 Tax=Synaphobranchus kaupii TaxID=118154 RepID=A0A9Q1J4T8_SYNKA|nr:hypothetical protein SKAU_G00084750 [Synaphobranchus kaupii]